MAENGKSENADLMVETIEFLVGGVKRLAKKVDARCSAAVRYYNDPEKGNRRRQITGFSIFGLCVILVFLSGCPKNQQENSEPAGDNEPVKTETPNPADKETTPVKGNDSTPPKPMQKNEGNNPENKMPTKRPYSGQRVVALYRIGDMPVLYGNERTKN